MKAWRPFGTVTSRRRAVRSKRRSPSRNRVRRSKRLGEALYLSREAPFVAAKQYERAYAAYRREGDRKWPRDVPS